jgi:hypothetical protein
LAIHHPKHCSCFLLSTLPKYSLYDHQTKSPLAPPNVLFSVTHLLTYNTSALTLLLRALSFFTKLFWWKHILICTSLTIVFPRCPSTSLFEPPPPHVFMTIPNHSATSYVVAKSSYLELSTAYRIHFLYHDNVYTYNAYYSCCGSPLSYHGSPLSCRVYLTMAPSPPPTNFPLSHQSPPAPQPAIPTRPHDRLNLIAIASLLTLQLSHGVMRS